jgi:potassium-transporting ATPase KdpC subunit
MHGQSEKINIFHQSITSGRIVLTTMVICCVFYTAAILGVGQVFVPYTANGSLIQNGQGKTVGSEAIAQRFSQPTYFWPRPSAVNYNASATGGSNLSPASPEVRKRAETILAGRVAKGAPPIPADLITASGSGIDPHITLKGARYQLESIASARGVSREKLIGILEHYAKRTGGVLTPEPLVNVLLVNMALDEERQRNGK